VTRGPICGGEVGAAWIDEGTRARTRMPGRGADEMALTPEDKQLLLDLGQMILDLAGIIDPTPISDGTNALISAGRGDWFGAGISAIAMVPLLGDLAKAGKLGRWAQTVEKTVLVMRRNVRFAERARPLLRRLDTLLGQVPTQLLPEAARPLVKRLRDRIDEVFVRAAPPVRRKLLERYWRQWESYIDGISLPPLAPNEGVLWARLPDGAEHAKTIAASDGMKTLEMQLGPLRVEERYRLAVAQLTQLMGDSRLVQGEIWDQFGRKVWEKLSRRYAEGLSGRVRAHVRFGGDSGLSKLTTDKLGRAGHEAIIWDELEQIADWMTVNPRITSVELVDVFTGRTKIMLREDVLRAAPGRN